MFESMFMIISWLLQNHPVFIIVPIVIIVLVFGIEEWRKKLDIVIGNVYGMEITFPVFFFYMIFALFVFLLPVAVAYNVITTYQMTTTDRDAAIQYEQDYGFCKYHTENITISKAWRDVTQETTTYYIETYTGDSWSISPETWEQFEVDQSYQIGIVSCSNGATATQPTIVKVVPEE